MAFLPTIADVQAISQDDAKVQAIVTTDTVWINMVTFVDKTVTEGVFGIHEFDAQLYLAAHILSMAFQPVGGRGPLSSETIGSISTAFTLPWLNRTTVLGGTQFGIMYLEIRNMVVAPIRVIKI